MANSSVKKFIEAGVQFTELSRKQAESLVRSLVKEGDVRRKDAEHLVQTLVERGRETSEAIATTVQDEMKQQVAVISARFEEMEHQLETLARQIRNATMPSSPTTPAPAENAPAENAPAEKAPAKKAPAKKAPAKKAPAKKAPARKKSRAAAVGSSGVRKVSTTRNG